MPGNVRILDTTIRDGGYMVSHHFTESDVATIAGALDRASIPLIEVGYGMGVYASDFSPKVLPKELPSLSAEKHAEAALRAVEQAQIGVLFGAGPLMVQPHRLRDVAEAGYSFVRLAIMPDDFGEHTLKYVRAAKDHGLTVAVNLMQTYLLPPDEVATVVARAADEGLDWFSVVDSAGGMSTDEVKRYVTAVLERADVEVGLHSHNNIGCGVANSLAAVEAGATMVDGTLNGMGRSTGNSPTEILAILLRKRLAHEVDIDGLVSLSRSLRSLLERGNDPGDFVSGGGRLHSRNVKAVKAAAAKRGRSVSEFLLESAAEASAQGCSPQVQFPESVYDALAERVPRTRPTTPGDGAVAVVESDIVARYEGDARRALEDLRVWSRQHHKASVLHIVPEADGHAARPVFWEGAQVGVSIAGAVSAVEAQLAPDYVVLDPGGPKPAVAARIGTVEVPFAAVRARAAQDLAIAIASRGMSVWAPSADDVARLARAPHVGGDRRPSGPVALFSDEGEAIATLVAGDTWVADKAPARQRVDELRERGVTILLVPWTRALASAVDAAIALSGELDSVADGELLVPTLMAPGTGQSSWNPDRATLVDVDGDPAGPAREAARRHVGALWSGKKSF